MAELDGPWRYPFFEEPELRRHRVVFRPFVPVSIAGLPLGRALDGLVDTGSESTLIAAWVADLAGLDLSQPDETPTIGIGVGGTSAEARFIEVDLRLHKWPQPSAGQFIEWRAEDGFVSP